MDIVKAQRIAASQGVVLGAGLFAGGQLEASVRWKHRWEIECYDAEGNLKWVDDFENIVVNTGLNDILDKYYKGSGYTASFFVGLTDGTPTVAAGDTMASHAGWTEITAYLNSPDVRPTLTLGSVASQSVDNSAVKAVFAINATATVGGAFLATDDEKGGTTGILVAAGAFSGGDKAVGDGDTLNVTVTLTASSS